ncbi:MAG TPA: heparinase II/III family protein, partial [Anaerolineales bacterium]|nr:heparinase II/III family protein [Anaerolineales bacterium]
MSTRFRKLSLIFKTLGELGPRQVWHFATYQIGLRSGYYRWRSPPRNPAYIPVYPVHLDKIPLPKVDALLDVLDVPARQDLDTLADELRSGKVRLFGGPPVALRLSPPGPLQHWTAYESQLLNPDTGEAEDIKWIWEPSRCIWGIQWGRTAYLSGSARDSAVFWEYVGQFWTANPPNMGPNWSSAQEIALRLISLCLAARSFSELQPLRPEESDLLSRIVASHADRLPLTLSYARAQNNNHLLAEAAGLYTAGILLPEHPQADRWRDSGWKWFNRGLQTQIAGDGSYIQNSANYHRLMLQLALWVNLLAASRDEKLPSPTRDKLAASTRWLLELVDPDTGSVPN